MRELSNLVKNAKGSTIRAMVNEAAKMERFVSFALGEPDFVTPKSIIEEGSRQLLAGKTHYTFNRGIAELRLAIAEYHKNDIRPNPVTEIVATVGATEALQLAMLTLLDPGDEIIVFTPAFANYFGQIATCHAKAVQVETYEENGFMPRAEDLRAAITDKTKVILINSPSNPTGSVIDADTLKQIAQIAIENDLWVISDEIYSRLVYDDVKYTSILEFEGMRERTVYISGFSKMFAMTGWRVGYAIAPAEVITGMVKVHEGTVACLPEPTQLAAAYGLLHCDDEIEIMRRSYEQRRNHICKLVNEIPGMSARIPSGAFYVFANVRDLCKATGMNTAELAMDILRKKAVVIVPGSGFGKGGEGYVRLAYAVSNEDIDEGMALIKEYAEEVFGI